MSVPSTSWDETSPAGTQAVSLGDDRIREMKTQLREVIDVDHDFPSSGQAADVGQHKQVTFQEKADIGTGASGVPILGAQTVKNDNVDKPELCFTDEDDDTVQITKDGVVNVQTGLICLWAKATAPTGWLLCQGQAINRTTYYDLFTLIGTTYGVGNGTTTFNIPDLQGKFPLGKSGTYALAATGGAATATLTTTELPSHTHTNSVGNQSADHAHSIGLKSGSGSGETHAQFTGTTSSTYSYNTGGVSADHTHTVTINSAGTGSAFSILNPYLVMNFIIKV